MRNKKIDERSCIVDDPVPPDDPRFDEAEPSEYHLINECGLSIIAEEDYEPMYTESEQDMINQFPTETPHSFESALPGYGPECANLWYETEQHDAVFVCDASRTRAKAEQVLKLRCARANKRIVGDVYKSGRYWCVRVCD